MKILIADDHEVVRKGLMQILSDAFGKVTLGEATNAAQALEAVRKKPWDVLVLDITMPGRSGLDVLSEIKAAQPKLPVLVLSIHSEEEIAVRVLKAGAAGYLTKQSAADELVQAIKKVVSGGHYITAALAERLAAELAAPADKPRHETLSSREYQVMKLLAVGRSVKEVAAELALSPKTINTYRARLMEKLDVKSDVELARYALRHRLVD